MELETKLDGDFLFYLGFTNAFLRRIADKELQHKCEQWLNKLLGEPCIGPFRKRCRNIYLARLLVCMQLETLDNVFLQNPVEVDIGDADEVFDPIPENLEKPAWLEDSVYVPSSDREKKGRTYFATRTLPGGQGAFAYIGISMGDEDNMWMGAGEGGLDSQLEREFQLQVPPVYEMEKILARRKDPREREKVLVFYDSLLQSIQYELDGKVPDENETVEGLLEQLIYDLQQKNDYARFEQMKENERRSELLLMLYSRVHARRTKVSKREEILDEIEEKILPKSFFESSVQEEDKYDLPAAMWEQAINKAPNKTNMEILQIKYPLQVIEKFLELLANYKEEIAVRMQRRHENIVAQMKKELRKEGEVKKKWLEEARSAFEQADGVRKKVKEFYDKKMEAENKIKEKQAQQNKEDEDASEQSKLYEKMKEAVFDTQKLVEEEACRGRFLAAQINAVNYESETYKQVNNSIIQKTEAANLVMLKNIKRLGAAIKQYEKRIKDIEMMQASRADEAFYV